MERLIMTRESSTDEAGEASRGDEMHAKARSTYFPQHPKHLGFLWLGLCSSLSPGCFIHPPCLITNPCPSLVKSTTYFSPPPPAHVLFPKLLNCVFQCLYMCFACRLHVLECEGSSYSVCPPGLAGDFSYYKVHDWMKKKNKWTNGKIDTLFLRNQIKSP